MALFRAAQYKEQLQAAPRIEDCEKVPVPKLKQGDSYIFISYSHNDYKQVYADLADLYENGIPFWYDKEIPAGMEWDDVVRKQMNDPRCCGVIFFLSESLFLSQPIQKEIHIVLGEDGESGIPQRILPYFSVNLTELSPGALRKKVYSVKQFDGVDDSMAAEDDWALTLSRAFGEKAIYLPFSNKTHLQDLVEQIDVRFGIKSNQTLYDFGNAKFVSGEGTIEFANETRYTGAFRDGLFDGTGALRFRNNAAYEGTWVKGKRHGQGTLTGPDGEVVYEGQWRDDKYCGHGRFHWPGGAIYDGEWVDNKRHGQGTMTLPNNTVYEGQWKDDHCSGQGIMTWSDGAVYTGQWKADHRHGQGRFHWPGKEVYEGQWNDNKRHGWGKMTWPDGTMYEGEWVDNKRHGQGIMAWRDIAAAYKFLQIDPKGFGQESNLRSETAAYMDQQANNSPQGITAFPGRTAYDVLLKDDKYCGQEQSLRPTAEYEGQPKFYTQFVPDICVYDDQRKEVNLMRQDKMTGQDDSLFTNQQKEYNLMDRDKMTWQDSSLLTDPRKENNLMGQDKMPLQDSSLFTDQWEDDILIGQNTMLPQDSDAYENQWKYDILVGQSAVLLHDYAVYKGQWKDDLPHGQGVLTLPDGTVYEGQWKDGKFHSQDILPGQFREDPFIG